MKKSLFRLFCFLLIFVIYLAVYWWMNGGTVEEADREYIEMVRVQQEDFLKYIDENALPEDVLRDKAKGFLVDVLGQAPPNLKKVEDVITGKENVVFRDFTTDENEREIPSRTICINQITGIVSEFTQASDVDVTEGVTVPTSAEEAFATIKSLLEYYDQPVDINEYQIFEYDRSYTFQRNFDIDGVRYLGKYFQTYVSRATGQIYDLHYFPVMDTPTRPEVAISKEEARSIAKRYMRRDKFKKLSSDYEFPEELLIKYDYSIGLDEVEEVITRTFSNTNTSSYYWAVPFNFIATNQSLSSDEGYFVKRTRPVLINMETGKVR